MVMKINRFQRRIETLTGQLTELRPILGKDGEPVYAFILHQIANQKLKMKRVSAMKLVQQEFVMIGREVR